MNILWLHQYYSTPKGWGAVRTYEFARRFVKAGHKVDVVCCAGYDTSLKSVGRAPVSVDGHRVFVSGTAYRPHMGFVRRVWSFLCFMSYALWFVMLRGARYDVMIASSGPLTLAVPALTGRWLRKIPFVFEVIDVWPDSAIAAGVLKNPVLKWLSFRLEALAYRYASAIVTCSTGMTGRVEKKLGNMSEAVFSIPSCSPCSARPGELTKVTTLSNCCDLEQVAPDAERRIKTRERLGVRSEQIVVLYTGAMGLSNAVADLVGAVKETADDERIVWWFAGNGPESGILKTEVGGQETTSRLCDTDARMNARARERRHWFGCLPKEEVVALYQAADVNVVSFMHEPLFYENSPNKFFDGIAAGLPTIFNRTTWLQPWLEAYGCGIVCDGEDVGQAMALQLKALAGDGARRQGMGAGARRLAEEVFSRDKLAAEYLAALKAAVQKRRDG